MVRTTYYGEFLCSMPTSVSISLCKLKRVEVTKRMSKLACNTPTGLLVADTGPGAFLYFPVTLLPIMDQRKRRPSNINPTVHGKPNIIYCLLCTAYTMYLNKGLHQHKVYFNVHLAKMTMSPLKIFEGYIKNSCAQEQYVDMIKVQSFELDSKTKNLGIQILLVCLLFFLLLLVYNTFLFS